jgi:hypothetical protein
VIHQLKRRLDIRDLFFSFCVVSEVCSYVNLFVTLRESAAAELAPGAVVVRIEENARLQWRVCSWSAKGNGAATLGYHYDDVVRRRRRRRLQD